LFSTINGELQAQLPDLSERSAMELSGDAVMLAIPGAAFLSTFVWKDDQPATWHFIETMVVSASTTYILKSSINKERPNGEDFSFPSGHSSNAFAGAGFIHKRYGWKWGVPAFLGASYVGYTRVHADKHDWIDVTAGALIGTGSAFLFTKPYSKTGADIRLSWSQGPGVYCLIRF
jgi:membrane-associated phospholipid phosphatase